MEELIINAVTTLGYLGIAAMMCLETVIPIIPSELIMPFTGFAAASGSLNLWGVLLSGTLGAVTGATILYWLGRYLGEPFINEMVKRYGKWIGTSQKDVDKANQWFRRHSIAAVTIGRVIPTVRSAISIPAGTSKMPLGVFLLCTTAGSLAWNVFLVSLGYLLKDRYHLAEEYVGYVSYAVLIALILVFLLFIYKRLSLKS